MKDRFNGIPVGDITSEGVSPAIIPIRRQGEGFDEERDNYESNIFNAELFGLPKELKRYKHRINWPIDMRDPRVHLSCFYEDQTKYTGPKEDEQDIPGFSSHNGIDIQAPIGTEIFTPSNGILYHVDTVGWGGVNKRSNLADIMFWSPEMEIMFQFLHIDNKTIPDEISRFKLGGIEEKERFFGPGIELGRIGVYSPHELYPRYHVDEDVQRVYGRSYNHLHVSTFVCSKLYLPGENKPKFNPILLFKKLY